jgi:hypothetical protein
MMEYKGVKVFVEEGKVFLNVFSTPEGEFPQWVEEDENIDIGYVDGLWAAFLIGEAKEKYLEAEADEDEAESVYPCMCGGGGGFVCGYCGGIEGLMW